ncbi:unnamed protein product [Diatraea saccharalis]|uniref:Uncharacterized protein n=1 Tax=Diatraea saccharalis TaxID=40085 RepID=A0A9N9R0S0_9NEOP|nr:unnamed protein product [Diatraea saccharalis]
MFRFIVVTLLLINCYSGIWGAPAKTIVLSMSLNELAKSCKSPFLATQMKNKLKDCEVGVPPYQKKQIECLLFYDINRQLCEAVASSNLALNEDYTSKILEEQDVSQLCDTAKDWKFTDIGVVYNKTVNVVFHDPVKCFKFCILTSDNLLSVDSTFYCKYFKWGSDVLKSQLSTKSHDNTAVIPQVTNVDNIAIKNKTDTNPGTGLETAKDIQMKQEGPNVVNIQSNATDNSASVITETANKVNTAIVVSTNKEESVSEKHNELPDASDTNTKPQDKESISQINTGTLMNFKPPIDAKDIVQKEKTTSTVIPNENKNKIAQVSKDATNQDVLNQIGNRPPIANGESDDYPPNDIDSEEVRDGLGDTHGDDDPDDLLDTKLEEVINKKNTKINEQVAIDNSDILPKETFSNTLPDFAEEDDHFFPFFLTAIIMVVLLYILYHNKNRVSKVLLGLIVEGRQPGRRRNSRGHAYRRLDTLEQAMSTNSSAPPSKIIY